MTIPENGGTAPDDAGTLAALAPDDLDGHTIDELADYLDAGLQPADPTIDDSAACRIALEALARLRAASHDSLEVAALDEPAADDSWVSEIMANISLEARAGRDIPLRPTSQTEHAVLTEGSVRALVRRAGDSVEGVVIGRCSLEGDVTVPGEPIRVRISASIVWGHSIPETAAQVRTAVEHELLAHTELTVAGIDVEIRDVHLGTPRQPEVER